MGGGAVKALRWLLCLVCLPAIAQVYPFFPPPGMKYNAVTGQLSLAVPSDPNSIMSLIDSGAGTNQGHWRWYMDAPSVPSGSNALHLQLLDDSGNNPTDAIVVDRITSSLGACAANGVSVPGYAPCIVKFFSFTSTCFIGDNDWFCSHTDNNDSSFVNRNTSSGVSAFAWFELSATGPNSLPSGDYIDSIPNGYTGPSGNGSHCRLTSVNAQTAMVFPALCMTGLGNLYIQVATQASGVAGVSNASAGVNVFRALRGSSNTITTDVGPTNGNTTHITNLNGGTVSIDKPTASALQTYEIYGGTKFTTSGCGVTATAGGGATGTFTLGSNTCSVVVTLNGATGATAPAGWSCFANDQTTAGVVINESASNQTTATFNVPAGAGATDVINFSCVGY